MSRGVMPSAAFRAVAEDDIEADYLHMREKNAVDAQQYLRPGQ